MKATKTRRFSLGMKIAAILSCVAIASVGFASWWIINYPGEKKFETGSFTVYAVDQKNIEFSEITAESGANVVFGKPASTQTKTKWLGSTGVENESLTTVLKFNVTLTSGESDKLADYLATINVNFNEGTAYKGLVNSKYLKTPVVSYRVGNTGDYTTANLTDGSFTIAAPAEGKTATIYLQIEFDWGEATNYTNPYEYFNGKSQDDTNTVLSKTEKEAALAMLQAIAGLNENYVVTITATPKSN